MKDGEEQLERLLVPFDRNFFDPAHRFKVIGTGSLGGKAKGLAVVQGIISDTWDRSLFPDVEVSIPSLTVIRTDVFDAFIQRNKLQALAYSDEDDTTKALAFQRADLPAEILGDLRVLVEKVHTPLAIRSSSVLEDALREPFAGVYETKMIPNNQPSPDERFRRLSEAVKLVYASTYFRAAREYIRSTKHRPEEEKMAVIIQEVVGSRAGDRYYPHLSGVARSYNFYAMGRTRPEDGVASLALGLGKTIVDGGKCWTYSPAYPAIGPPHLSPSDRVKLTQSSFWAVNMGKPPAYDPVNEREYLVEGTLKDAEEDDRLARLASTYDPASDRITPGVSRTGARVLDFAPLLTHEALPVNRLVRSLLSACETSIGEPLEIEFAMTFDPPRFGFLQARPMVVSSGQVSIGDEELRSRRTRVSCRNALGNGIDESIADIVFVKPESFSATSTKAIALELESINRLLSAENRPYLLIGFGRWGSSDPFLGIPVVWGQISGARAIVEASNEGVQAEISQGSHFFHNLTSFSVRYFSLRPTDGDRVDWTWLRSLPIAVETSFVCHATTDRPLIIKVDGTKGIGTVQTQ